MKPKILTIVGKSDSGKTTLLIKIVEELTQRGYAVGTAKHAHDGFEMDKPGKDSWRHRKAGAASTLLVTDETIALMKTDEQPFVEKLKHYLSDRDIILAEGFKSQDLPKLEIFRKDSPHKTPLFLEDPRLVAFVTDSDYRPDVPVFGLEDIDSIADFIEQEFINA